MYYIPLLYVRNVIDIVSADLPHNFYFTFSS